jgi:hypothetical protein
MALAGSTGGFNLTTRGGEYGTAVMDQAAKEADAFAKGPSAAEVRQKSAAAAQQGAAVAQAGATEAAQGLMGAGTGAVSVGRANDLMAQSQLAGAETGAQANLGAREMLTKEYQDKRQSALSTLQQESQFQRQMAGQHFDSLMGGAAGVAMAFFLSDRRLKENIEQVGVDESTGLGLYDFNYIGIPESRYRGVMAQEVEVFMPEAVVYGDDGFMRVNYGLLGLEMQEV